MSAAGLARKVLPPRLKHWLRDAERLYGTATGPFRLLPDFLIVGAQKSGTTSLYAYLVAHPEVDGPAKKEVDFFQNAWLGERWYRGHFPWAWQRRLAARRGRKLVVGEASPNYIERPEAAAHAAELVPDAKLILLLRNPVDRALSHYNHERTFGREPLSFPDALAAEQAEIQAGGPRKRTYRSRGVYADQLEAWLRYFPLERFLVLGADELDADTDACYRRALEHIGVRPQSLARYERKLARAYDRMDEETRRGLEEFYREPNERLFALIGRRLWGA